MTTETFCNELPLGLTQKQIDDRVAELKTLGGALDAFTRNVGAKVYICAVRKIFGEPLDGMVNDPERAGAAADVGTASTAAPATAPAATPVRPSGGAGSEAVTLAPLTEADYHRAAVALDCEAAAIRAVADVECGGRTGFLADGRPKILFESHVFARLTGGRYNATHPDISTPNWIKNYAGGAAEYDRLDKAMQLDREAALKSTSWGKFQIMGFNGDRVGFSSVDDFVAAQRKSEQDHLDAFVQFILSRGLSDELRQRRWDKFAESYNGPGYRRNRYDEKMAAAYARYTSATG